MADLPALLGRYRRAGECDPSSTHHHTQASGWRHTYYGAERNEIKQETRYMNRSQREREGGRERNKSSKRESNPSYN